MVVTCNLTRINIAATQKDNIEGQGWYENVIGRGEASK